MGSAERVTIFPSVDAVAVLEAPGAEERFARCTRTTELVLGERKLLQIAPGIRALRRRCEQDQDVTTDPHYFIAANALKHRRLAAVLIRRNAELEAVVFFFEHCRLGIGLGIFRGGDGIGESLVVGPEEFRVQYVHLATQSLLGHWRIHGVSLVMLAGVDRCMEVMQPGNSFCKFSGRNIQRKLPLAASYRAMLDTMGRRTRRSLAKKRQQLEKNEDVQFVRSLGPAQAHAAMLQLQSKSRPHRNAGFYHARCELVREHPEFFCMGMRLPTGTWLSVLSGWRRNRVTYVDLQMNDQHFKKESLSAVMRAYLLEHEIGRAQETINFVGGTSLLLRRYCRPSEPCTHAFFWRPCLRATLFRLITPHLQSRSVYERVQTRPQTQTYLVTCHLRQ